MFTLSKNQDQKLQAWLQVVEEKARALTNSTHVYYGAVGGGLTYTFTPTSIGVIIIVKEHFTQEQIDLTEYDLF